MKTPAKSAFCSLLRFVPCLAAAGSLLAQTAPQFTSVQWLTNKEAGLKLSNPAGCYQRLEGSLNLADWLPVANLHKTVGTLAYTDSAAPYLPARFYRAWQLTNTTALTGDYLVTAEGAVLIQPINHATLVMGWNDKMIYVDPVGGSARFTGIPKADLVLVTHEHTDHFDAATITAIKATNAIIIATKTVYASLPTALKTNTTVLTNGMATNVLGLAVDAIPAYNIGSSYHPKGVGNGYILTIGAKRIYLSGDTSDTPEMRALRDIDVAFLAMNQPYTMTVAQAVSATREFRPSVAYPYHSQGTDVNSYKRQVGTDLGIQVRLRKWY